MLLGIVTRENTRYLLSFSSSLHSRFPSTTPEPSSLSFLIKWAKSEEMVRGWSRVKEIPEEEEVTSRLLSCVLTRLTYWRPSSIVLAEQKLNYSLDWKIKSFFVPSFRHCFPSLWSSVGRQACLWLAESDLAWRVDWIEWSEGQGGWGNLTHLAVVYQITAILHHVLHCFIIKWNMNWLVHTLTPADWYCESPSHWCLALCRGSECSTDAASGATWCTKTYDEMYFLTGEFLLRLHV